MLKAKLVWTTLIATGIFALCYVAYSYRLIGLDDLATALGLSR
jgi:hypothetical protein